MRETLVCINKTAMRHKRETLVCIRKTAARHEHKRGECNRSDRNFKAMKILISFDGLPRKGILSYFELTAGADAMRTLLQVRRSTA